MKILIVNAGSSSLKYQLVDMNGEVVLAKGLVARIGLPGSSLEQKRPGDAEKYIVECDMPTHVEACKNMLAALTDKEHGVVTNMDEIGAVGHRVLHGGEKFTESVIINDDVLEAIRENIPLGPLHNPANLMGIQACQQVMPTTPMVAVFDTAFHQTMPPKAYLYGVPLKYYKELHVRRYGFHGTSHRYVSARAAEFLGKKAEDLRIITVHLGNGSSLAAVDHGKCMDTSMGLTPLEGVLMGTRSGNLDPAVVQFIMNNAKNEDGTPEFNTIDDVLNMLNKKSGLAGMSGLSPDMRDINAAAESGNEAAELARQVLFAGIRKYIGAYAAVMGGVDVIAFAGGIGENGPETRHFVMENFEYLGAKIDEEKNAVRGKEADISAADSKVKVLVIPTNEEIVIARDTLELVTK